MSELDNADFVNPYNFVPLPRNVRRIKPWGHVGAPEIDGEPLYSGRIAVEWELKSPLKLPSGEAKDEWWDEETKTVRIPGTSIKGAVRSLHETLFNGCLRIFDADHVPGYRMPAQSWPAYENTQWKLALVTQTKEGKPKRLQLGSKTVFVSAKQLVDNVRRPKSGLPTTGDLYELNLAKAQEKEYGNTAQGEPVKRFELPALQGRMLKTREQVVASLGRDERISGCVFLATSLGARNKKKVFWAATRLTDNYYELQDEPSDKEVLLNFERSCAGTDDRRRANNGAIKGNWRDSAQLEKVEQDRTPLGFRIAQTGLLFPGDVVWVQVVNENGRPRLKEIRLAQIWRRPGARSSGERVYPAVKACKPAGRKSASLCLSCATFGSIDAESESGHGENAGYRGHVSFSAAVARGVRVRQVADLAPLSLPKPGAGTFYLAELKPEEILDRSHGDIVGHWGGDVDRAAPEGPSALRGRKFYWHADPDNQTRYWKSKGVRGAKPRYEKADGQPLGGGPATLIEPMSAGQPTKLRGEISFDRLPKLAVDALLAAIDPNLIKGVISEFNDRELAIHLGGGKPFGLGSALPRIVGFRMERVAERYARASELADAVVEPFTKERLGSLAQMVGRVNHWEGLFAMLSLGWLGDDEVKVSYPPGAVWRCFGSKEFAQSYEFFGETNGEQLTKETRKWVLLPERKTERQLIEWTPKPKKNGGHNKSGNNRGGKS